MKQGFFITFEGGEGSGKSTQSKLLMEALRQRQIQCRWTREPGGSPGAEEIRQLLVNGTTTRWDGITETLLFMAARRNHLSQTIWPALAQNEVVICDRFLDSTLAYQGYGYGKNQATIDTIMALYRTIAGDFYPNLTFIFDIDPLIGLKRSCDRAGNTEKRFENMDLSFHKNLRTGFLELAQTDKKRYVVIDATGNVEEIHHQIVKTVLERLKNDSTN